MLLCFCGVAACSLPGEPDPPKPRSLESAIAATHRGDLPALRRDLGKDTGLSSRARLDMATLDPEAWLVLMGARWREHDLAACRGAANDSDMAVAMGFSEDALTSSLLNGASRRSSRFSNARRYFREVDAPLNLIRELAPGPCPGGLKAYVVKYKAELTGRVCMVRAGFAGDVLVELHAAEDIGRPEGLTSGAPAHASPALALRGSGCEPLQPILPANSPPSARGLEIAALDDAATLYWVALAAENGRWQVRFAIKRTLIERLQGAREEALRVIRDAALAFHKRHGRWPARDELGLRASDWVDAAGPDGQRGWQRYAPSPEPGFMLDPAANASREPGAALAWTLDGRFGIAVDGRFLNRP